MADRTLQQIAETTGALKFQLTEQPEIFTPQMTYVPYNSREGLGNVLTAMGLQPSNEEYQAIFNFQDKNGIRIFDKTYSEQDESFKSSLQSTQIELINLIATSGVYNAIETMTSAMAQSNMSGEDTMWYLPSGKASVERYEYEYALSRMGRTGTVWDGPCPKCKNRFHTDATEQNRAADEGATTKIRCLSCGHEFFIYMV